MILIQTCASEFTTDDVLDWIYYLDPGIVVQRVNDTQEVHKVYYNINNEQELLKIVTNENVIDTKEISSFWYRRGAFSFDSLLSDSINTQMGWPAQYYLDNELQHILSTINKSLNERFDGINKRQDNDTNKISNLRSAIAAGLKVPDTLICTDKSSLYDFIKTHESVISKVLNTPSFRVGISETESLSVCANVKLLTIADIQDLEKRLGPDDFLPCIFQQYINKKFELRIFFLMGQFYPMAIFSQENEKTKIDFRNYDGKRPNRCIPYRLPEDIEVKLKRLMHDVDLNSGSIDMIYTTSGEYIFLEVNPIGQFQWLDKGCNYFIDKKIANYLLKNKDYEY